MQDFFHPFFERQAHSDQPARTVAAIPWEPANVDLNTFSGIQAVIVGVEWAGGTRAGNRRQSCSWFCDIAALVSVAAEHFILSYKHKFATCA